MDTFLPIITNHCKYFVVDIINWQQYAFYIVITNNYIICFICITGTLRGDIVLFLKRRGMYVYVCMYVQF